MTPGGRSFRFPWRSTNRIRADVDDELSFHIDMRAAELVAAGMSADDARREATREFGDVEFTRRYCRRLDEGSERATRRGDWLADVRQDATQAVRVLRRSPGFLAVALLTVALGVGANSAIFTVVRGVLLRPLPFADPNRLVSIYENNVPDHSARSQLSAADYVDYRRDQSTLTDIGVVGYAALVYQPSADPVALHGLRFSANVFSILGGAAAPRPDLRSRRGQARPEQRRRTLLRHLAKHLRRRLELRQPCGDDEWRADDDHRRDAARIHSGWRRTILGAVQPPATAR